MWLCCMVDRCKDTFPEDIKLFVSSSSSSMPPSFSSFLKRTREVRDDPRVWGGDNRVGVGLGGVKGGWG